jgi:hypothetical protein
MYRRQPSPLGSHHILAERIANVTAVRRLCVHGRKGELEHTRVRLSKTDDPRVDHGRYCDQASGDSTKACPAEKLLHFTVHRVRHNRQGAATRDETSERRSCARGRYPRGAHVYFGRKRGGLFEVAVRYSQCGGERPVHLWPVRIVRRV